MTSSPHQCSVVVCAWTEERWDQLGHAVASARAQVPPPHEVVLVIDHNDRLLARARREVRDTVVVASTGVRGLSGARNTGVEHASGDVVLFLDDDAVAAPDWLACHLAHYADDRIAGVGGHVSPHWLETRPQWFPDEFGWVVGCSWTGQPRSPARVRNPIGANMSFRRGLVLEAGGFHVGLGRVGAGGQGAEETELSVRLARLGLGHVLYDPAARVRHDVPAERANWRYFRARCLAEGRSKARMSREPGPSLEAERHYVRHVLPVGLRRELVRACRDRDADAALRGGAIVAGLALTAVGYLTGRVHARTARTEPAPQPVPGSGDVGGMRREAVHS